MTAPRQPGTFAETAPDPDEAVAGRTVTEWVDAFRDLAVLDDNQLAALTAAATAYGWGRTVARALTTVRMIGGLIPQAVTEATRTRRDATRAAEAAARDPEPELDDVDSGSGSRGDRDRPVIDWSDIGPARPLGSDPDPAVEAARRDAAAAAERWGRREQPPAQEPSQRP